MTQIAVNGCLINNEFRHVFGSYLPDLNPKFGIWKFKKCNLGFAFVLIARISCNTAGVYKFWVTKLYMVELNVSGSSIWYLLHVTFLVPTILRWLLHWWEICQPLLYSVLNVFQDLLELGHRTFGLWVRCGFSGCRMWPVWYFNKSFVF
jgi:hypothetical protein